MNSDDPTKNSRAWLLPAADGKTLAAGLYLVATPIGNLRDITIRALDTLQEADIIFCEDTRVTGKLLTHYGIKAKKLKTYTDHNADKERPLIIEHISKGASVVLVSDAGTPLVSDPGYKLVRDALEQGCFVTTLPGANAPLSALQLSAMPSDSFYFYGFLPTKDLARKQALQSLNAIQSSIIFFESARRLLKTLEAIKNIWGNRNAAVVREITKMFEESRRDTLENLIAFYEEGGLPKGEIVIVVEGTQNTEASEDDLIKALKMSLKTMSLKDAVSHVSENTGAPKKAVYALALELKNS